MEWQENRELLKRTRERLGLSQADLAKESGIPKWVIADCESGRRRMKGPKVSALWQALATIEDEKAAKAAQDKQLIKLRLLATPPEKWDELIKEDAGKEAARLPWEREAILEKIIQDQEGTISLMHEALGRALGREKPTDAEMLLQDAQQQINSLKAELSGLRNELVAEIKRLESELRRKLKLAAREGANILSENGVAADVIPEQTKAESG